MVQQDPSVIKKLEIFFRQFSKVIYEKGEIILRAEDTPVGVYFLQEGFVRQSLVSSSGEMFIIHVYKPGSFFPLMWVVNDTPNTYYFEAMTPVEIWHAPREAVREFLADHPAVVYDFASRLLAGVTGMMKRMAYLVMENAYTKTMLLLLYLAHSLGEKERSGVILPVPVSHREISAWIGTTRETASLQVERLKKRGLIVYRKRQLIIPSLRALEKEIKK